MSDKLIKSVLESMSEGLTVVDSSREEHPIVRTNQSFLEITGYDESEVVGHGLDLITGRQSSGETWNRVREAIEQGQAWSAQIEATRKNGERFWDRITVKPVHDGSDPENRVILLHEDVTEQRQLKQTLQESRSKLQGYLNVLPDLLIIFNREGEYVDIHSGNPDLLTRPIEEQKGDHISEDYPDELVPDVMDTIQRVLDTNEPTTMTYPIEIDGKPRWFEAHVSAFPRERRDDLVLWLTRDITDRIRLRNQREEREQRLQLALEGADAGIWERDVKTEQQHWDKNLCELYGVDFEDQPIDYHDFLQLVHPEDRERISETEENLKENQQYQHELRIETEEGYRWFQARGTVFYDDLGEPDRVLGVSMDITEQKQARRELRLFRETLDQSPDLCFFIDPETGRFQDVIGQAEANLGYTRKELQSMSINDIDVRVGEELDREEHVEKLIEQETLTFESIHRHKDGTTFPVRIRSVYIQLDEMDRIVSTARDITERKEKEQQFQQMAENIEELFYIKDLEENKFTYVSPAIETILGYSTEDLLGHSPDSWLRWIHPSDHQRVKNALPAQRKGEFNLRYRILRPDGDVRWIYDKAFPVETPAEQEVTKVVGVAQDITEQMELREQLQHQALYDSLTELPNRTLFEDRLEMTIKRLERNDTWPFAVVYFDLNNFKEVNDTYGHSFGDQLLRTMSSQLQDLIRDEDTVARFGGDEFLMLLETIENRQDVSRFLERLQDFFQKPFSVEGREIQISTSIGVELATRENHDPEELIRNADTAMFSAKQDDSSSICFYEQDLRTSSQQTRQLQSELETAFQEDQFVMHYQPILDLASDRVIGLEALVRWQHPQKGLLLPADFLPVIFQSTALPDMDRHVIRKVCSFMDQRRDLIENTSLEWISVNVTPQFFLQADATDWIIQRLRECSLDPGTLYIEVTEKTALQKLEMASDNLRQLAESGLCLAVDDFGTGYSSLMNVRRLPVNVLKLDRSLIDNEIVTDEQREILNTAIRLAEVMELTSITEGIETEKQLQTVKDLGSGYAQGFLFDKALPPDEIRSRLAV